MKKQRLYLLVCLSIAITFLVSGTDRGAYGESQPDDTPQSEQGGQTTPDKPDETAILKTQKDQVNYAIGVHLIGNLKRQGVDIDLDLVMKGMQDAYSGEKLLMKDAAVRRAFIIYQREVRRMQAKTKTRTAEENRNEGEAFLKK